MARLVGIELIRATVCHITKWAAAGTDVTHNHKGCGTIAKALRQIRAGGFFTDGIEFLLTQGLFDALHLSRGRHLDTNPIWLFLGLNGRDDLNWDTGNLIVATQLFTLDGFFWFWLADWDVCLYS